MNATQKNILLPIEPLTLIVCPEDNKMFEYLSQYLTYTKIDKICSKERIEDLIRKEKIIQDMITNNCQYKMSKLASWSNYINWVVQLIPEIYKEQLRLFLTLEAFTKSMLSESIFYSSKDFISYWIYYIDMCRDDLEILQYLVKNQICTKNYFLFESMAIMYEKFHDFRKANKCYLDGLDNKVDNVIELQQKYHKFELRMENRINREIAQSCLSNDVIQKRLNNDIKLLNEPKFNEKKRRSFPSNNSITLSFNIQDNQIHFITSKTKRDNDNQNLTVNYGSIPVFVDEPFRDNLITKGTQIVELYILLVNILLEKDLKFKEYNDNFIKGLKAEYEKKPYSWLSSKRAVTGVQSLVNTSVNDSKEETETVTQKSNKQMNVDTVVAKIEDEISQSSIKEKQKKEGGIKPIDQPLLLPLQQFQPQIQPQKQCDNNNGVNPFLAVLQGRKETIVMRKKTKENESLIDLRIAYYKVKIEESERKQKEEYEKEQHQIDTNNFKLDSDGDILMSSDNEEEKKEYKQLEVKQQLNNKQEDTTRSSKVITLQFENDINNNPLNNDNKKAKSPQKNINLFNDLTDLEVIHKEDIQKKKDQKKSSIENNSIKANINYDSNINNNNVNKEINKQQQYSNPLELYINPQPLKNTNMLPLEKPINQQNDNNNNSMSNYYPNQIRETNKRIRQPDFNNIKPIEPKDNQTKFNNKNSNNINHYHNQLNHLNPFLLTPDKKDFSLSFDSNHSHLFKENKKPFEDTINNNRDNVLINLSGILDNDNIEERKFNSKSIGDINKFFPDEEDETSFYDANIQAANNSKVFQKFITDDEIGGNNNLLNQHTDTNRNRMSSITEKTIENTRNSSVNSASLEKLFNN